MIRPIGNHESGGEKKPVIMEHDRHSALCFNLLYQDLLFSLIMLY